MCGSLVQNVGYLLELTAPTMETLRRLRLGLDKL